MRDNDDARERRKKSVGKRAAERVNVRTPCESAADMC